MTKYKKNNSRAGKLFVIGCWIILALVAVGYFTSEQSPKTSNQANNEPQQGVTIPDFFPYQYPLLDWTQCPDEDKHRIGEFARYLMEQRKEMWEVINKPYKMFSEESPFNLWMMAITDEQIKLQDAATDQTRDYYNDVVTAADELIDIAATNKNPKPKNYQEKTKEITKRFEERIAPYLEW